jgi:hypothetical protein
MGKDEQQSLQRKELTCVSMSDEAFTELLNASSSSQSPAQYRGWTTSHSQSNFVALRMTRGQVALRITRGPTNACITFHCHGSYATGTVQIAINDPAEYQGGQLCFFVNNELFIVRRPAGSVSKHPRNELHAVTSLTMGTRKSLFVVDIINGLGGGWRRHCLLKGSPIIFGPNPW